MKLAGFLLMIAGWVLVASALMLLSSLPARMVFVVAGIAVQLLGFVLVARAHLPAKADPHAR
jgi:hypothetical protein